MIGVITKGSERNTVEEFFELFKTPWEFYRDDRDYDVILATDDFSADMANARMVVVYASRERSVDHEFSIKLRARRENVMLEFDEGLFPVFGEASSLDYPGMPVLTEAGRIEVIGVEVETERGKLLRIGYDLFKEIEFLLSSGQPSKFAYIPTLDIHISLLRKWITDAGVPLVEIPPVPPGRRFFACLTHDVDFVGIRRHRFDHTFFGFLYRAGLKSLLEYISGRSSWQRLKKNWKAVLSVPFIHLGVAKDFMILFDRYLAIEKDLRSTFFLIPFKNRPGRDLTGRIFRRRGSRYDVCDVKDNIRKLRSYGCEVGLHGIDAWRDSNKGREELDRITTATGNQDIGARMHWLYYDKDTPNLLDKAGFLYDSTFGYNETVGYRSGTSQAFRPLNSVNLLELPLIIQDTALFYSSHMGLREKEALEFARKKIETTAKYGGVMTINWHHRSIGPERLWDEVYVVLLEDMKKNGARFGTAAQIVKWFKKRRSVSFKKTTYNADSMHLEVESSCDTEVPDLILRIHKPRESKVVKANFSSNDHIFDVPFTGEFSGDISLHGCSQCSFAAKEMD